MAGNSLPRRIIKRALAPLLDERHYVYVQAATKAWDIRTGGWTEPQLDIIRPAVRAGETAIDIGANFGLWSYWLSRAVGPSGRVHAFEPIPFTSSSLTLVARLLRLRNVELHRKGCGEKTQTMTFTLPVQESGAIISGLVYMGRRDNARPGRDDHFKTAGSREVSCEVVSLDEFLPALARPDARVSFLKCDIEGADLFALRGARRILEANHPTVCVEMIPWFMEGFGLRTADVAAYFEGLGYGAYRYLGGRLQPLPPGGADTEDDNWIFIHPSRRDRFTALLASG